MKPLPMILIASLAAAFCLQEARAQSSPVTPLSLAGLDSLVTQRQGRPLILNVFATWCEPCKEEFPDLMRAAQEYPQVETAALSVDYPDEAATKIGPFIASLRLRLPVFVSAAAKQEEVINFLAPKWSGALPATFIYSGAGARDTFYVGRRTLADFREAFRRASMLRQ